MNVQLPQAILAKQTECYVVKAAGRKGLLPQTERASLNSIHLAVNGTLMRGLELNENLIDLGAEFVREDSTASCYRLYSIDDRHPAMLRDTDGGVAIDLEIWSVPTAGLATLLLNEPPGLCIGKVKLFNGEEVLGIVGEPALCAGMLEITRWSGWRKYLDSQPQSSGRGKAE